MDGVNEADALRTAVLSAAGDAGIDFAYYDRKEDEDLSVADLEKALRDGVVGAGEILAAFAKGAGLKHEDGVMAATIAVNEAEEREDPPADAPLIDRVVSALDLILRYSAFSAAHHKDWVFDQVVRRLTGSEYDEFVRHAESGGGEWEEGGAP